MNTKEQENQLAFSLGLRITTTVLAYLFLAGFVSYRLYIVSKTPKLVETTNSTTVPTIKRDNFEILRGSIKATFPLSTLPIIRSEPFD